MTPSQAATFVLETIRTAKASTLREGICDEQMIYVVCNMLSVKLNLDLMTVLEIFSEA